MSITPLTPRPVRGGYRVRQASHADVPEMARMKARAWRQTYAAQVDEAVLDGHDAAVPRMAETWRADMDRGGYYWVVVDPEARIVGVAHAAAARDPDAPEPLELTMIYLLDEAKGSGIADRLLQMAIGDAPCSLWVLDPNPRAQAFYRRHGFVPDGSETPLPHGWRGQREIRMVRRPDAD